MTLFEIFGFVEIIKPELIHLKLDCIWKNNDVFILTFRHEDNTKIYLNIPQPYVVKGDQNDS